MRSMLIAIVCFVALVSLSVAASDKYPSDFVDMDANGDGRLTWAEFHDFYPELSSWEFGGADRNNDGVVTPEEWTAFTRRK